MILSLGNFHMGLMVQNFTTNEYMGISKYRYLMNDQNQLDNPFARGSAIENIVDALMPTSKEYYSRAEVVGEGGGGGAMGEEVNEASRFIV